MCLSHVGSEGNSEPPDTKGRITSSRGSRNGVPSGHRDLWISNGLKFTSGIMCSSVKSYSLAEVDPDNLWTGVANRVGCFALHLSTQTKQHGNPDGMYEMSVCPIVQTHITNIHFRVHRVS